MGLSKRIPSLELSRSTWCHTAARRAGSRPATCSAAAPRHREDRRPYGNQCRSQYQKKYRHLHPSSLQGTPPLEKGPPLGNRRRCGVPLRAVAHPALLRPWEGQRSGEDEGAAPGHDQTLPPRPAHAGHGTAAATEQPQSRHRAATGQPRLVLCAKPPGRSCPGDGIWHTQAGARSSNGQALVDGISA